MHFEALSNCSAGLDAHSVVTPLPHIRTVPGLAICVDDFRVMY